MIPRTVCAERSGAFFGIMGRETACRACGIAVAAVYGVNLSLTIPASHRVRDVVINLTLVPKSKVRTILPGGIRELTSSLGFVNL